MKKFYDTNALIQLGEKAFEEEFFVASTTLQELEHIKTSKNKTEDVRYKARKVTRLLDEFPDKYKVIVWETLLDRHSGNYGYEDSPDMRICDCAYWVRDDAVFVTNDICCKNIAKSCYGLNVESVTSKEEIYKGYRVICGNTEYINEEMSNTEDWITNEYLIIENTDDDSVKEMRFDGEKFVGLKLPPSKFIKAKNSLQRCALDLLMNPNITIAAVLGTFGSGKTHLSMQMALYNVLEKGNQSKILGVRSPQGEGKEIGYLPGDIQDKVGSFFEPLTQQLNGGEFELESLKQRGILDVNIPFFMKGTTYNDTVILVDEAEDLDDKQLRLVGTRVGENSKIYFCGDYRQSVINADTNNSLIKMCNEFKGNPSFGCVCLGEDVRSETSKLFADLFAN